MMPDAIHMHAIIAIKIAMIFEDFIKGSNF
jgi:hypothetical protein